MGKGKQKGKRGDDDDEVEISEKPQQQKQKKGGRRGDDDSDDGKGNAGNQKKGNDKAGAAAGGEESNAPALSNTQLKKLKREAKKQNKGGAAPPAAAAVSSGKGPKGKQMSDDEDHEDEEEEEHQNDTKNKIEEDESEEEVVVKKGNQNKGKQAVNNKKNAFQNLGGDDSDEEEEDDDEKETHNNKKKEESEEEEEEEIQPSKNNKTSKTASAFSAFADDSDDDEEDDKKSEEEEEQKPKSKSGKKEKKKSKSKKNADSDNDESGSEDKEAAEKKKKKKSKKSKDEEEENDDDDAKGKSKSKSSSKKSKGKKDADEDEDANKGGEEDKEESSGKKDKSAKKKSKKEKSSKKKDKNSDDDNNENENGDEEEKQGDDDNIDNDDGKEKAGKSSEMEIDEEGNKKEKDAEDGDENDNDDDDGDKAEGAGDAKEKKPKKEKKISNKQKRKMEFEEQLKSLESQVSSVAISNEQVKSTSFSVSATSIDTSSDLWQNATDLIIPQFSISANGKPLFQDAELRIVAGRRYGLVGPNGMGKTTVLKQIANGELPVPPRIDALYVEQEVVADDTPAVDMVLAADTKRTALLKREQEILEKIDAGDISDELQEELREVSDAIRSSGADGAEARALSILHGLGFTEAMQRAPTKTFSGGWRMRVSIARALFMEPTLLLLDEPTNHLDLGAVIWLDDYLQKYKYTLLVVSHDQDFLDSVCTDIIALEDKKLVYYRGNYEKYREQLEIRKEKLNKDYEKQQKQLKALKASGKSNQAAKDAQNKKNQREAGGAKKKGKPQEASASASSSNTAMSGARGADGLLIRPRDYEVNFEFPEPDELNPPIIQVKDVSFKYPGDKNPVLFKNLSFGIDMQSRVTIVGPNGVGKSTLLKLMTRDKIEPTSGDVIVNPKLRIARYHQHFVDELPMRETPVEYLRRKFNEQELTVRQRLGRFGLPGTAHTIPMQNLSGGQKARVVFTAIAFQNPHILVLDEPTNNLDMESIDALIDAINDYEGGVVLVSHDARLITATDMVLWVCENQTVEELEGGFPAYREEILHEIQKREIETKMRQEARQKERDAIRVAKMKEMQSKRSQKTAA